MNTTPLGDPSPTPAYAAPHAKASASEAQQTPTPLPAAKTPVGAGGAAVVGLILAVLLIVVGVVAVHDAFAAGGVVGGTPWIDGVAGALDGVTPAVWVVPVGVVLVLVGLWLLLTALRPRPRAAITLHAKTGVFLRPRDVATLARSAAQDVDGVTSAKVTATTRKITVAARTTTGGLEQHIAQAVTTRLGALAKTPTVRVTLKSEGR